MVGRNYCRNVHAARKKRGDPIFTPGQIVLTTSTSYATNRHYTLEKYLAKIINAKQRGVLRKYFIHDLAGKLDFFSLITKVMSEKSIKIVKLGVKWQD